MMDRIGLQGMPSAAGRRKLLATAALTVVGTPDGG
jgi:hypothetical protein